MPMSCSISRDQVYSKAFLQIKTLTISLEEFARGALSPFLQIRKEVYMSNFPRTSQSLCNFLKTTLSRVSQSSCKTTCSNGRQIDQARKLATFMRVLSSVLRSCTKWMEWSIGLRIPRVEHPKRSYLRLAHLRRRGFSVRKRRNRCSLSTLLSARGRTKYC
jgi:hypothetical protein